MGELQDLATLVMGFALIWSFVRYPFPAAQGRTENLRPERFGIADFPPPKLSVARFATYNIHGCRGRDGTVSPGRIAADIRSANVDVAALQEVHNSWVLPRQPQKLAREIGLPGVDSPTRWSFYRGNRSNLLFSRFPIEGWERQQLPHQHGKHSRFRNITVARVNLGCPVYVIFTHLQRGDDPTPGGRLDQLQDALSLFLSHSPAILLGDLNTRRFEPLLKAVLDRSDVVDAVSRFLPEDHPRRIDWILCRGLEVMNAGRVDSGASDHPLYWCDVAVPSISEPENDQRTIKDTHK